MFCGIFISMTAKNLEEALIFLIYPKYAWKAGVLNFAL